MSPRAAWRLEALRFRDVAHYAGGIADWMASGLDIEGTAAGEPRAGTLARSDVPTCGPREAVGEVRERVRAAGYDTCFVVNDQRVVLGRLLESDLERADAAAPAEEAMRPGPSTWRPDVSAHQLMHAMDEADLRTAPVTTSEGVLVGLVHRSDVERALERGSERREGAAVEEREQADTRPR